MIVSVGDFEGEAHSEHTLVMTATHVSAITKRSNDLKHVPFRSERVGYTLR